MIAPLLVTLVLARTPASSSEPPAAPVRTGQTRAMPGPATPAPATPARLERGYLRVDGIDRAPLVDALQLRVPHLRFEPFEAATAAEPSAAVAFVELRHAPPSPGDAPEGATFRLTIVVSDGRAFDRTIATPVDPRETARLLASTVANLLLAIEAGTVLADRGDVPLPAATLPVASPCVCECAPIPSCPSAPPGPAPPEPAPPGPATPPRLELGPVAAISTVLGLGPPRQADRFAAVGATVGLHARLRGGAFFGFELRTAGRGDVTGTSVGRQRIALGAGHHLRRAGWSLCTSLWATVEPWWLRGAPIDPPPRPQWGLAARITPSLEREHLAGGRLGLAVGPMLELSASAALSRDGAQVGLVVTQARGEPLTSRRVGGFELSTGLAVTAWLAPRRGLPRSFRAAARSTWTWGTWTRTWRT